MLANHPGSCAQSEATSDDSAEPLSRETIFRVELSQERRTDAAVTSVAFDAL